MLNGGARRESAAVQPNEHGLFGVRVKMLRPDIEVLAVLIERPIAVRHHQLVAGLILLQHGAHVAVSQRVFDALPRLYRGRLVETLCIGVFYAVERICAVKLKTAQLTGFGLDDRVCFGAHEISCHISQLLKNLTSKK